MDPSRIAGAAKTLAVLVLFLVGLGASFALAVVVLGRTSRRLRAWDTPAGRVLRAPVGVAVFLVCLGGVVGLMCALAVALDRGLAMYW